MQCITLFIKTGRKNITISRNCEKPEQEFYSSMPGYGTLKIGRIFTSQNLTTMGIAIPQRYIQIPNIVSYIEDD
jgi:hypothetical protein